MQNRNTPFVRAGKAFAFIILCSAFCILLTGCQILGIAANAIPQNVKAQYAGLQGQDVGVMVWADRGIMIDWETLPLDLGGGIQERLSASQAPEAKGITWPYPAASYVRYMRDHPGAEAYPIEELAPKLGVSRLIYIEVQHFRTRSRTELELFRGEATATLKVIEVSPDGVARVGYTEDNISAIFPRKAPTDGLTGLGDDRTYRGVVDELANEVVMRFVTRALE